jgi:hypothetical protein
MKNKVTLIVNGVEHTITPVDGGFIFDEFICDPCEDLFGISSPQTGLTQEPESMQQIMRVVETLIRQAGR